jgi:hypothetical protein
MTVGLRIIAAVGLVVVNAILLTMLSLTPGPAHPANDFYGTRLGLPPIKYKFDNAYPGPGPFREQTNDAFQTVEAVGSVPNYDPDGEHNALHPYTPCDANHSNMHYRNMFADTGVAGLLGIVSRCVGPFASIARWSTVINNQVNWYTGDGDVPNNQFDVRSVVTHEAVHTTGWNGHFQQPGPLCPDGADTPTMCEAYPENFRKAFRTLEEHDRHTIVNAYP